MKLILNVIGLGHPTKWHVSINNDFVTREEAEQLKEKIETAIDVYNHTPILTEEQANRKPTKEEIQSMKEAEEYYSKHETISFDSRTRLLQHIHMLEHGGYLTSEWHDRKNELGNILGSYKVYKVNTDGVKKNEKTS